MAAGVLALAGLTAGAGAALAGPAPGSQVPAPTPAGCCCPGRRPAGHRRAAGRGDRLPPGQAAPGRRRGGLAGAANRLLPVGDRRLALALLSPIEAYDTVLFSVHVVQHMLLTMAAAPLLALGAPITLALRVARGRTRRRMTCAAQPAPAGDRPPLVAWVLFTLTLYGLYFSPLFDLTLRNPRHDLRTCTSWPPGCCSGGRWSASTRPAGACPIARLGFVFLMVPFHAFLGVAIMNSGRVLARPWRASSAPGARPCWPTSRPAGPSCGAPAT